MNASRPHKDCKAILLNILYCERGVRISRGWKIMPQWVSVAVYPSGTDFVSRQIW